MALEGHDVCALVWDLLVADSGAGGVNTLLGGTPSAPGRIYQDLVPQAAPLPAATVGLVAAPDLTTLSGDHVLATVQVDVRVIGSGTSYSAIAPIARRVNVVLHGASGTAGESYAYKLERIDFRRAPADDGGVSYRQMIATYATPAHPAP
jgi:uncharacterized protein DUF3168